VNLSAPKHLEPASVPCGTCQLCCKKTLVLLVPEAGDDVGSYVTRSVEGVHMLATKANGDCFYLGEAGCTIHDRAPIMCKVFDCRGLHAMYSRDQRRNLVRQSTLNKEVLAQGNFLLRNPNG